MRPKDALALLGPVIPEPGGRWADLGAGTGTFTRALAQLLGPAGRVYAVDRDASALASLQGAVNMSTAPIVTVVADFTGSFALPGAAPASLDGLLLANALHFVADAGAVLAQLTQWLRPGGRAVLVEYDRRGASRWVPHPIWPDRLPALARAAGLSSFALVARRPSSFGGDLYVAVADRCVEGNL